MKKLLGILSFLITFLSCICLTLYLWINNTFGIVNLENIIFTMATPMTETEADHTIISSFILNVIALSLLFTLLLFIPGILYSYKAKIYSYLRKKNLYNKYYSIVVSIILSIILNVICYNFFILFPILSYIIFILSILMCFLIFKQRIILSFFYILVCFIIIIVYLGNEYQIWDYIKIHRDTKDNKFYENKYVDPRSAEIIVPQQKKNLILISLESMEFTFANLDKNYIPELSKLAERNITFTNYKNGYAMDNSQTSIIATLCGIPSSYVVHFAMTRDVRIASFSNTVFSYMSTVASNAYSISQILKEHGYTLAQFEGADNNFANNRVFLESHGFDIIEGLNELKLHPSRKRTIHGWGISDDDLFDIVKDKTRTLSKKQPFFLYCMTSDTHFATKETEQTVTKDFQKASKLAFDFVQWVQAQDFAKNTVIIMVGDHLRMGKLFQEIPNRNIYNVFINSQATPKSKDRTFWAMDLCPTILEAIGFKLKNPRLGLGVSLFSSEPTLLESMGQEKLTNELRKNNEFYNSLWQ